MIPLIHFSADGEPHISITSDALVHYTGAIVWKPPSIYKSFCEVNFGSFLNLKEVLIHFSLFLLYSSSTSKKTLVNNYYYQALKLYNAFKTALFHNRQIKQFELSVYFAEQI